MGKWEQLATTKKNDDEKVRTSNRLPHLKRFPYSATGKIVTLANQQV
ncbi:hypothetical protein D051_4133 [Vibrio parahaemolyticus VPCR-2010]|nr:hypothetical protein D051_4133 [Vibrio parahaemolyticus VPCR-2010]